MGADLVLIASIHLRSTSGIRLRSSNKGAFSLHEYECAPWSSVKVITFDQYFVYNTDMKLAKLISNRPLYYDA